MPQVLFAVALLLGFIAPVRGATVRIAAPAEGTRYVPPATVTVTSIARVTVDGEQLTAHRLHHNDLQIAGGAISVTEGSHNLSKTITGLTTGVHRFQSGVSTASGGGATATEVTITVNAPPTVALTAPAGGATFVAPASISLTANASDSDGSIVRVEFYNGSTLLGSDSTTPYSFTWSNVPGSAASYALKARAIDNLGGVIDSATRTITVNALPTVALSRNPSWGTMTSPAAVTLTAAPTDSDGTIARVEFYQGSTLIATDTTGPVYSHSLSLTQGNYSFTAKAIDNRNAFTTTAANTLTVLPPGSGPTTVSRKYFYDQYRQLCKVIEPETGATLLGYDAAANLAWSAAGLPATTACDLEGDTPTIEARSVLREYDARNRLTEMSFPDGRGDQTWEYTPDGLPRKVHTVNVVDANNIDNAWEYNARRMLKTETQLLPAWYLNMLTYGYDRNGSLQTVHYPSGQTVDYAPNALGQATKAGAYANTVTYHPNGSIAAFNYGNGVAYQMLLSPVANARPLPARTTYSGKMNYAYTYDKNGNVGKITDDFNGRQTRTMGYDGLDRLKAVASPMYGSGAAYDYDALDNLTQVTIGGTAARNEYYCYDQRHQLTNIKTGDCGGTTISGLEYDFQGNLSNRDGEHYDFDYGNRLREVIEVERYRYDAFGRRILAMNLATGALYSFYGQSGQLLYQENTRTGQMKMIDHIYLAGSLIAQREVSLQTGAAGVRYLHTDALGSPVVATNSGGAETERMEYEPYGLQLKATSSIGQDLPGYTGHVRDAATGLVYAQQRYLDSEIPQFLSTDPVTALSDPLGAFHRYRYANNNPYKFIDPDGRLGCAASRIASVCESYGMVSTSFRSSMDTGINQQSGSPSRTTASGPVNPQSSGSNSSVQSATSIAKTVADANGMIAGTKQHSLSTGGTWRGANGKVYDLGWGGNQHTGARSLVLQEANAFRAVGQGLFLFSSGISLYEGAGALQSGDGFGVAKAGVDISWGAAATFGGPAGFVGAATYSGTSLLIMIPSVHQYTVEPATNGMCWVSGNC